MILEKQKDYKKPIKNSIKKVAVIGAGTMGHGLALVHAIGGCEVDLYDTNPRALSRSKKLISAACETLIQAGVHEKTELRKAKARIYPRNKLAVAVADADLIVEAVVERADVKKQVFSEIGLYVNKNTIIASNTSYLDVFRLLPPGLSIQTLIAHWYTPPYIIDLVDIAPGPETNPENVEEVRILYEQFGKAPLIFDKLIQGYIANRLQSALNLECLHIIDEGWAEAKDIDFSIKHGLATRLAVLGHMRKMDFTGLEMVRNALASRAYSPPKLTGKSPTLERLIEAGNKGVMSGAGHYEYGDVSAEELFKDRDLRLLKMKKAIQNIGEKQI